MQDSKKSPRLVVETPHGRDAEIPGGCAQEVPAKKDRGENCAFGQEHCPDYRLTGAGPLLVNIPGLDGTGELIFKQMPGLAKYYRVATFRLRESRKFSYEDLAGDVAAIIRDTGYQRATILGESFGGTVALWFALLYPHMLDRLAIVNSFPWFRNRLKITMGRRIAATIPFRAAWYVRVFGTAMAQRADGVILEDRRRCFSIMRTVARDGYVRRLELIEELDLRDRLKEIDAPALLIAADRDLLVPSLQEARFMASRMPRATIEVVQGAGHACLMGSRVSLASVLSKWTGANQEVGQTGPNHLWDDAPLRS